MSRPHARRVGALGLALVLALGTAAETPELSAQEPGWMVTNVPHVDLWYHGMAVLGLQGSGPLALYHPDYAAAIGQEKEEFGVSTRLDRERRRLRDGFASDNAFEFLHFLPLYFVAAGPTAMFEALRTVARTSGAPDVADRMARSGAIATAYALPSERQRGLLLEFVDALEDEWEQFYSDHLRRNAARRRSELSEKQAAWDSAFAVPLGEYLGVEKLNAGWVLIIPALGRDGRVFRGDPDNPTDNIVAVGELAEHGLEASLHAAVRKLCFPLVGRALQAAQVPLTDRVAGSRLSGRMAVRCGEMLLDRYAPELTRAFRRTFAPGGSSDAEVSRAFASRYALDPEVEKTLSEAVSAQP